MTPFWVRTCFQKAMRPSSCHPAPFHDRGRDGPSELTICRSSCVRSNRLSAPRFLERFVSGPFSRRDFGGRTSLFGLQATPFVKRVVNDHSVLEHLMVIRIVR